MKVSFNGNIYLRPNTYLIKKQNGEELKPASNAVAENLEINTDKVAYVTHQQYEQGANLYMINGDVITVNPPFNVNMYNIAQQLNASQTLAYDSDGKISIYDKSIDKLREEIKSGVMPTINDMAAVEAQKETSAVEVQPLADNTVEPKETKAARLESTYTLNGIDYDVVRIKGFDNLGDFQRFILSKGMTNRGLGGNDWPGQCHNFSCEYGDIMLGSSKIDINSDTAARQATRGKDRQFQNVFCKTNDAALELMRAELEEGRPCVVKIKKPGTNQNHYGLVCGIRKDADRDNLKNTDFLYIDSYDGKIGQLNGKNYRELNGWKNSVHIWQGKNYNFEYRNQNGYAGKYASKDEVKKAYGLA